MPASILSELDAQYRSGALIPDPGQKMVAQELQTLADALRTYRPSWWLWSLARRPPRGLYIQGTVGRGKSMLMDLFFACVPTERKWRVHFHEFMSEVHARRKTLANQTDPLPRIAESIADQAWVLCFDEFYVDDIADAMIMARFFTALFKRGVIMVATSNHLPSTLYADGLHRERFLPFIDLLSQQLNIITIDGERDYRRRRLKEHDLYNTSPGPNARDHINTLFKRLTDNAPIEPSVLTIDGRQLPITAAHGVARFDFQSLCNRPLGAIDYQSLAHAFDILILEDIPYMSSENSDAARRFVTLIDILYECRIRLICSAAAEPEQLFTMQGHDFSRTISRLEEMRSTGYPGPALSAPKMTSTMIEE